MKAISSQIVITSIRSRKDRSAGFSCETPELTDEQFTAWRAMQGKNIQAVFSPLDEPEEELIEVQSDVEHKSQAQRLRSVLFLLWKQQGEKGDFRDYYNDKTEKIINKIKGMLDD